MGRSMPKANNMTMLTFRAFDNKAMFVHQVSYRPMATVTNNDNSDNSDNDYQSEAEDNRTSRAGKPKINQHSVTAKNKKRWMQTMKWLPNNNSEYAAELNNFAQNHMQKRLSQPTIALEQLADQANDAIETLHRSIAQRALAPLFCACLWSSSPVIRWSLTTSKPCLMIWLPM